MSVTMNPHTVSQLRHSIAQAAGPSLVITENTPLMSVQHSEQHFWGCPGHASPHTIAPEGGLRPAEPAAASTAQDRVPQGLHLKLGDLSHHQL